MRPEALSTSGARIADTGARGGRFARWRRRHAQALRLGGCFLTVLVSVVSVFLFTANGVTGEVIWTANGVLLAYLLLTPRWTWPAYLVAGAAGFLVGGALIYPHWQTNIHYAVLDMAEVIVGAFLLRRRSRELPRFTDINYVIGFLGFAVIGGTLIAALLDAVVAVVWGHKPPLPVLCDWLTADGLGMLVVCPTLVAILSRKGLEWRNWREHWVYPALLVAVTTALFAGGNGPVLFVIYPFLLLVVLRLGLAWASAGALFVVFEGAWFTHHGLGPLARTTGISSNGRALLLQLFVAAGVFMIYTVSMMLESRHAAERRLEKIASQHALVTENSRDAILIADFKRRRNYASAAVERITGWTPEEFSSFTILEMLHPDDLDSASRVLDQVRAGAEDARLEGRVLRKDGGYGWIEASLRLIRDPETGEPKGFVNVMRDIGERKRTETVRAFHHSLIRAIYEVSLDGILVVNHEGNVVSYNQKFSEVWQIEGYGFAPSFDEEGATFEDSKLLELVVRRVKDKAAFLTRVRDLYADPEIDDQCEIVLTDGRTLERYSTSVRDAEGHSLGRVWFFRDVSGRKVAQQKLQEAYKAVEALASMDALTGLANRRRFDQVLGAEWRRGLREIHPVSLLMIDVDFFKSYNDLYGHPRGDSCLRQVAEAARDVVSRSGDLVARFGGEEFAVVLPNTNRDGAMRVGLAICDAMRARRLPHEGNPLGIMTVSIGCAAMVPSLGQHPSGLIEAADQALYEAKHRGRDQIRDASTIDGEQKPVEIEASAPVGRLA